MIFQKNEAIGMEAVESALRYDGISRTPNQFAILEKQDLWPKLSLDEVYIMLSNTPGRMGSEKSWAALLPYWLDRVRASGQLADEILTRNRNWRVQDIMQAAKPADAKKFLETLSLDKQKEILRTNVAAIVEEDYYLYPTWMVVELSALLEDPRLIQELTEQIHLAYDQASGPRIAGRKALLGMAASYLSDLGKTSDPWCRQMAAQYQVPPLAAGRAIKKDSSGWFFLWGQLIP